jgi:hypothetical protein
MAALANLATSAEFLPRSAAIIPPGSYQQKVSSGLLCERKRLLKTPHHVIGIMIVDRPFLFVIHHAEEEGSGSVLFMGVVFNPSASR